MKNIIIGVLGGISLFSLVYIVYDIFIKEEKVIYQECNKDEICEECICDNEYENDEEPYEFHTSSVYTEEGKIYKLDVYREIGANAKIEYVKLNNKSVKLETKDGILYFNDKKINNADYLYVTSNYIVTGSACQNGLCFMNAITEKEEIIDLDNDKTIGEFQTEEIYLTEKGNLVAIGGAFCGLDCAADREVVTFKNNNGKLEITKEKLK